MKRLKLLTAISLAITMMFGTVGCMKEAPEDVATSGKDEITDTSTKLEPEEGAELILWTDKKDYGDAIVEGFNKLYPDVKITAEEVGFTDARNKMELDGPAGNGADVFMISHNRLNSAISSGIIDELDSRVAKNLEDKLSDIAIKSASKDGILYGAPVSIESVGIFYNKDVVKEPAKSFEEIFESAKGFNNPQENKFAFMMDVANSYSAYGFLSAYGYKLFGEDGTNQDSIGFDTEEFVKGLEFFKSLREILPVQSQDLKGEFINQQFKDGKVAYILGGPWNIKEFKDAGVNFGVSTLPTIGGNTLTPFGGLKVAHVSPYSKYPNAANLLVEYMASENGANTLYEKNYKATALEDITVVDGLKDDEDLSVFTEQFKTAFPAPNAERIDYFYSIGEKTLALVFDGQLSPKEAAEKAIEEWNSLVASE